MIKIGIGLIIIFIAFIPCSSCDAFIEEDDELTLPREDYTGNQLRLDGIYYHERFDSDITKYALYNNGILKSLGTSSKEDIFTNFLDGSSRWEWGLFLIEDSTITIERLHVNSGGFYEAYTRKGVILNDTTFHILESYRTNEEAERDEKNVIYHFAPFSPKPDSTNSFID
jgi:hypothetical protein